MSRVSPFRCAPSIVVLLLLVGCSDATDPTRPSASDLRLRTVPSSPTVTSASPAAAAQGTVNLDVQITGSGFDAGTKAGWYLNGVPYAKVTINNTRFVSSSHLVANVTIAADAAVDNYDIVATTSSSKQGIGSDLFAITLATAIPVVGKSINGAGQVVGQNGSAGALWDPAVGVVTIQKNSVLWAIDESGTLIAGQDASGHAAIWTSAGGARGPWTATALPSLGSFQSAARALVSDNTGHAVILAGNVTLNSRHSPAVWTRSGSTWLLRIDTLPSDVTDGGWAQGLNVKGMTVGLDGATCCNALYWDAAGTATHLAPLAGATQAAAYAINDSGTIVVGNSNGLAVMWQRTLLAGVYGPWAPAVALEQSGQICGSASAAYAVNGAGTIAVGESCNQAVAWFIDANGNATRHNLGGLGPPNTGVAFALNNLASPNAAGQVNNSGAFWRGF
jgi:uncharacterized membrane protein